MSSDGLKAEWDRKIRVVIENWLNNHHTRFNDINPTDMLQDLRGVMPATQIQSIERQCDRDGKIRAVGSLMETMYRYHGYALKFLKGLERLHQTQLLREIFQEVDLSGLSFPQEYASLRQFRPASHSPPPYDFRPPPTYSQDLSQIDQEMKFNLYSRSNDSNGSQDSSGLLTTFSPPVITFSNDTGASSSSTTSTNDLNRAESNGPRPAADGPLNIVESSGIGEGTRFNLHNSSSDELHGDGNAEHAEPSIAFGRSHQQAVQPPSGDGSSASAMSPNNNRLSKPNPQTIMESTERFGIGASEKIENPVSSNKQRVGSPIRDYQVCISESEESSGMNTMVGNKNEETIPKQVRNPGSIDQVHFQVTENSASENNGSPKPTNTHWDGNMQETDTAGHRKHLDERNESNEDFQAREKDSNVNTQTATSIPRSAETTAKEKRASAEQSRLSFETASVASNAQASEYTALPTFQSQNETSSPRPSEMCISESVPSISQSSIQDSGDVIDRRQGEKKSEYREQERFNSGDDVSQGQASSVREFSDEQFRRNESGSNTRSDGSSSKRNLEEKSDEEVEEDAEVIVYLAPPENQEAGIRRSRNDLDNQFNFVVGVIAMATVIGVTVFKWKNSC